MVIICVPISISVLKKKPSAIKTLPATWQKEKNGARLSIYKYYDIIIRKRLRYCIW